jgi:hypothetical protein
MAFLPQTFAAQFEEVNEMNETTGFSVRQTPISLDRVVLVYAAHKWIADGVKLLGALEAAPENEKTVQLLAGGCVAMANLGQGFEHFLHSITYTEKIEIDKREKKGNHDLLIYFDALCVACDELPASIATLNLNGASNPVQRAREILERIEQNFMKARYFGTGRGKNQLGLVSSKDAALLAVQLAAAFPNILRVKELAETLGLPVSQSPKLAEDAE